MRKLRTYKGVTYDLEYNAWRFQSPYGEKLCDSAARLISWPHADLTDDDHAELMRLKAEPYEAEPKVTLEDVVARFWSLFEHQMGFRLRGSIEAEATRDLCKLIRTAFPHIDQEER